MSIRALIIDDEPLIRWSIRETLQKRGYQISEAGDGKEARAALRESTFDLILLDHRLPDTTGLDLLESLSEEGDLPIVIMMTAYGTIENAVHAMKLGAYDFIPKPFEMEQVLHNIDRALETTQLRREVRALREHVDRTGEAGGVIGRHPSIQSVLETMQRVAQADGVTVLLRGETGTGKDLVARAIHQASARRERPFVNVTCTALSETLLESELFGHERGAFTDARARKEGLLELAHGGTAFLDEIGDMPQPLQAKLLRFLEERRFRRVGGTREIDVDVRIIAATNRDIEEAIRDKVFRADLFFRLNVVSIDLPPLRARGDDVCLLAQHFLERFAMDFNKQVTGFEHDALQKLMQHDWPGNVRELRNVVERAVLLSDSAQLDAADIHYGRVPAEFPSVDEFELPPDGFDLARLADLEVKLLREAMKRSDGNQVHAAGLLGISRDRLRYRLKKHGLL